MITDRETGRRRNRRNDECGELATRLRILATMVEVELARPIEDQKPLFRLDEMVSSFLGDHNKRVTL